MKINDVEFNVELGDILTELRRQLRVNGIPLLTKIKDSGADIMVQCPYHSGGQERRPSAGIRKSDGMFHCFACNETHTLPEVISHCFGKDAVGSFGWQWLIKNFVTVKVEERPDINLLMYRRNDEIESDMSKLNYVSDEELDKYRYYHPYMYERGLTDDIIDLFDIGYDSATQCITFPVRDIEGHCLFVARRSVNSKYFNYPKGVEKPLYGLYELYRYGMFYAANGRKATKKAPVFTEVIVCESMLDALKFWVSGKYAVALNGLGNELQFKQLRDLPCRKIIVATDMDDRGLAARENIKNRLRGVKLVSEYFFPVGRKDANDCTVSELVNLVDYY